MLQWSVTTKSHTILLGGTNLLSGNNLSLMQKEFTFSLHVIKYIENMSLYAWFCLSIYSDYKNLKLIVYTCALNNMSNMDIKVFFP